MSRLEARQERVEIDLGRLNWYDDFFEGQTHDHSSDLMRNLSGAPIDGDAVPGHATGFPLSESSYWRLFLSGYASYERSGNVAVSDPYVAYLTGPFREGNYDPGLSAVLASADATAERVRRRYEDMDRLAAADPRGGPPPAVDPVALVASAAGPEDEFTVHVAGRPGRLVVHSFDGYHRVFAARFLGFSSFPCRLSLVLPEHSRSLGGAMASGR